MKRQPIDRYAGPTTLGIDVSAYQGEIDWPAVARGTVTLDGKPQGPVRFAVVRSGDGIETRKGSKPDPTAVRNLAGAADAGLPVAVYHYVRAYHDAEAQVAIILDVIRTAGVRVGFVALDLEGRPDDPTTPDTDESHGLWWRPEKGALVRTDDALGTVLRMARLLRAKGLRVLTYTGVAWHWYVAQKLAASPEVLGAVGELWTPYYSSAAHPRLPVGPDGVAYPWQSWRLWQYSAKGTVPGIRGPVDLNRFRGDEDALAAWWVAADPIAVDPLARAVADVGAIATRLKATHPGEAAELWRAVEKIAG